MSEQKPKSEFLWHVHSYMNEHIRHADLKAELVIGWTSALIGVLTATRFYESFDRSLLGIASCAGFLALGVSFILAFWTICPRLWTTQLPGFIFWRSILAHKDKTDFVTTLKQQPEDELESHVAGHLYDLSRVADAKFNFVGLSIYVAFGGSFVCGLTYFIGLITK